MITKLAAIRSDFGADGLACRKQPETRGYQLQDHLDRQIRRQGHPGGVCKPYARRQSPRRDTVSFTDVKNHWGKPYIQISLEQLPITKENVTLNGYKDMVSVDAAYLENVRLMVLWGSFLYRSIPAKCSMLLYQHEIRLHCT